MADSYMEKRNELNEQILHCRSELSKIFPAVLVQSMPKFRMPILNFLTICNKLRPKKWTNLSVLKLFATHRLKSAKLQLPFQKNRIGYQIRKTVGIFFANRKLTAKETKIRKLIQRPKSKTEFFSAKTENLIQKNGPKTENLKALFSKGSKFL